MYSISDAEHLSKNTVCHAVHKVVLALTKPLDAFVVFPGYLSILKIKEAFYVITDNLQYKNTCSIFNMQRLGVH